MYVKPRMQVKAKLSKTITFPKTLALGLYQDSWCLYELLMQVFSII